MGRRAIPIELIDEARKRQTTFNKRKSGLLKKAAELSILCDVEISVVMFSKHNGETKMHQYSSSEPQAMLENALTFAGPVENFTNASFPHASSLKVASKRGEKRPRDDAFAMNPIALMTQLLSSTEDDFADIRAPHSAQKMSRPRTETVAQAYADSLEERIQHNVSQIEDTDSHTLSNVDSNDLQILDRGEHNGVMEYQPWESIDGNDSHSYSNEDSNDSSVLVQGQQNEGFGGGTWESTGGNENIIPTSMPTSSLRLGTSSMTLKPTIALAPVPSPIQKLDLFGQGTQPWRRDLNVHIPHSNTRSAAEISARIFKTPKSEHEHQTFPNSFENQQGITDLPLDPLATPKTPFGFPSPATMNAARLVTSEPVVYPTAPNFSASAAM